MQSQAHPIRIGTFQIAATPTIGHVVLDGEKTKVHLSSNEFYHFGKKEEARIHGVLTDHEKITLIDCVTTSVPGTTTTPNGRSFHASVFPHYVVTGDRHLEPEEPSIIAVELVLENAHILFWDHAAFGLSVSRGEANREFLEQLTGKEEKKPEIGEYPEIFYFTGKHEILSTQTEFGRISAAHRPTFTLPTPKGLRAENRIPIRLEFEKSLPFQDALHRVYAITVFVEILMGSEQCAETLTIELASESEDKPRLDVYQSMAPRSSVREELERPHPGDILLNGGLAPGAFSAVLAAWLKRQSDWRQARFRFIQSLRAQNCYTIDRLVAAANLFDILPQSAVGEAPQASEQLGTAASEARKLFKALPPSQERDSVLGALGRVGKHNLRAKIEHRAKLITDRIGTRFHDMNLVIGAAIAARNYFVHGSSEKLPPDLCYEFSVFFTDTLEFIFAASDLIEAGWDVEKWNASGTTLSHPFGRYRTSYDKNLASLKAKTAIL